jgi:hypothetical protein
MKFATGLASKTQTPWNSPLLVRLRTLSGPIAATGYPQIYVRSTANSWRGHGAHDDVLLSAITALSICNKVCEQNAVSR